MGVLYVLGFQPIDIISKEYNLIDIINLTTSEEKSTVNDIYEATLSTLRNLKFKPGEFLLVNSQKSRSLLPYCNAQHTIMYDPPYVSNSMETKKLFQDIVKYLGGKNSQNIYLTSANSLRALLTAKKLEIKPSVYFNALSLLTDLNHSDISALEKYILTAPVIQYKVQHKAIYMGDPVHPSFFDRLTNKKVATISYLPYEYFCLPVADAVTYYSSTPHFDPINTSLIELRRIIREQEATMLILNPRGIYLTAEDARYISEQLQSEVSIYILPNNYQGGEISVPVLS